MTPEQTLLIEQAERLDKDATPGPWCHNRYGVNNWPPGYEQPDRLMDLLHNQDDDAAQNLRDAEFIAESRTLVPALAAKLKRALEENAKLRGRLAKCEPYMQAVQAWQSCNCGEMFCEHGQDAYELGIAP